MDSRIKYLRAVHRHRRKLAPQLLAGFAIVVFLFYSALTTPLVYWM